jgi:hypothetical protein
LVLSWLPFSQIPTKTFSGPMRWMNRSTSCVHCGRIFSEL